MSMTVHDPMSHRAGSHPFTIYSLGFKTNTEKNYGWIIHKKQEICLQDVRLTISLMTNYDTRLSSWRARQHQVGMFELFTRPAGLLR